MKTISKKDKEKIDAMTKKELSEFIWTVNYNSGAFSYAVKTFANKGVE